MQWSLEQVPGLNTQMFTAILLSITQSTLTKYSPLELSSLTPQSFEVMSWEQICSHDELLKIIEQYSAMFNIQLKTTHTPKDLVAQLWSQWLNSNKEVTFFTSGSTGQPKPCTHSEIMLRQEITSLAPLFLHCTSSLITVPIHHLYGFTFGLLLSMTLKLPIRSLPALPSVIAAQMQGGDLVIGIPYLWSRVIATQQLIAHHDHNITILTATAPTEPHVMTKLQEYGFKTFEFFGASETGVLCYRTDQANPFSLLPHVNKAQDSDQAITRKTPQGEVITYQLLDEVEWHSTRLMLPKGRKDQVVQVAGRNVSPQHIITILCQHPEIAECNVRLMRPEEGDRLKAFIVPQSNAAPELLGRLRIYANKHLSKLEQPIHYTLGIALPRTLAGKPGDWNITD